MAEFQTPREVSDRLGANTTEHTVRRFAKASGHFTSYIRNQMVFTEQNYTDLVEYIKNPPRSTEVNGQPDAFAPTRRR